LKKIDLIKAMNVEQMATMFMETKVSAVETALQKLGIYTPISKETKEKSKEEIKQFLEMEVLDYD
jgi:hypothetical protein